MLSRCGVDFAFALAFLVPFPDIDKYIGTFSGAATSVCARQESKGIVLAWANPFKMCEFKWQWLCAGGGAGAKMTPILKSSSSALPSLLSRTSVSPSARPAARPLVRPSVRHTRLQSVRPSDPPLVTSVVHAVRPVRP